MRFPDLICSKLIDPGTWVMLVEDAPSEYNMTLGSESVMRVLFSSALMTINGDGDILVSRKYVVEHQHRGRMYFGIPEEILRPVDPLAAKGQVMIHKELCRTLALELFPEGL